MNSALQELLFTIIIIIRERREREGTLLSSQVLLYSIHRKTGAATHE